MARLQQRNAQLEDGLQSALQIILQLSSELQEVKTGAAYGTDAMGHIDELESVDSLVDLLNFIRDESANTGLLLQPKV